MEPRVRSHCRQLADSVQLLSQLVCGNDVLDEDSGVDHKNNDVVDVDGDCDVEKVNDLVVVQK